jgi:hypothetical protein
MLEPMPVIIMRILDLAIAFGVASVAVHTFEGRFCQSLAKKLAGMSAVFSMAAFWLNWAFNY